jgi:hypothetical protein
MWRLLYISPRMKLRFANPRTAATPGAPVNPAAPSAALESLAKPARRLGVFLLKLLAVYLLALALWPVLGSAYRTALIEVGNAFFASPTRGNIIFRHYTEWEKIGYVGNLDVAVLVRRSDWRDARGQIQHVLAKAVSSFQQPYTATAFLTALFLATPMPWSRRVWRWLTAQLVLYCLMFGAVWLDIKYTLSQYPTAYDPYSDGAKLAYAFLHSTMTDWPIGVFLVPLFLWLLLGNPWHYVPRMFAQPDFAALHPRPSP